MWRDRNTQHNNTWNFFNKNDSATILSISVEAAVSSRNKQQENIL